MAYSKTTWVNETAPAINATNLNNMETGIEDAHDLVLTPTQKTDLTDSGESTLHYHDTDRDLDNASGVLAETKGGTGESTYTQGDILYASGSNNLAKLPKGTSSQVLTMNDAATLPNWENSESGFADPMTTRGDLIVRNSSNVTDRMAVGIGGQVLSTDGVDFTWVTNPFVMPAGVILPYGGTSAPSGYLLCDGSAVSRTTYGVLFTAIGTAFGVGNGSTTFNIPDMQGNIPVGKGGSGVTNIGDTGGAQTHLHDFADDGGSAYILPDGSGAGAGDAFIDSGGTAKPEPTNYSSSMQPYVGTEYIIKT